MMIGSKTRRVGREGDSNRNSKSALHEKPLLKLLNAGSCFRHVLHQLPVALFHPPHHANVLQFHPPNLQRLHHRLHSPPPLLPPQPQRLHLPPPQREAPPPGLPPPHGRHLGTGSHGILIMRLDWDWD